MTRALDQIGPVDYLVVEFRQDKLTGEAFPLLVDLVDRGVIHVLDLAFLRKDADGAVSSMSFKDLEAMNLLELALFEGAGSGLLDDDDLVEAANALQPGTVAAILIYENTWAAPFATALRRAEAEVVASGRIPLAQLVAALDALEAQSQADRGQPVG